MCSIEAHKKEQKYATDEVSSGGTRPLPSNSTQYGLIYFGLTINFTESWLNYFKYVYLCQKTMYCEEMHDLFKKIPVTLPEPYYYKNRIQLLLTDIGG